MSAEWITILAVAIGSVAGASGLIVKYWLRPGYLAIKGAVVHVSQTQELLDTQILNGSNKSLPEQLHELADTVKDNQRTLLEWHNLADDRHRLVMRELTEGKREFASIRTQIAELAALQKG